MSADEYIYEMHERILRDAAYYARFDQRMPNEIAPNDNPFQPLQQASRRGGLNLSWADAYANLDGRRVQGKLTQQRFDEIVTEMAQIGRDAIVKSLRENASHLVQGLFIDAREGIDYFARFRPGNPEAD